MLTNPQTDSNADTDANINRPADHLWLTPPLPPPKPQGDTFFSGIISVFPSPILSGIGEVRWSISLLFCVCQRPTPCCGEPCFSVWVGQEGGRKARFQRTHQDKDLPQIPRNIQSKISKGAHPPKPPSFIVHPHRHAGDLQFPNCSVISTATSHPNRHIAIPPYFTVNFQSFMYKWFPHCRQDSLTLLRPFDPIPPLNVTAGPPCLILTPANNLRGGEYNKDAMINWCICPEQPPIPPSWLPTNRKGFPLPSPPSHRCPQEPTPVTRERLRTARSLAP